MAETQYPTVATGARITGNLLRSMLPRRVIKAGNVAKFNNTMSDDPELTISVEANAVYDVRMDLAAGALLVAGIQTAWSVPAGTTGARHVLGPGTSANDGSANNIAVRLGGHNLDTPIQYAGVRNSTAQFQICEIAVVYVGTTAGALTLRWAQITTNATGSIIAPGSRIRCERIA